ALLRDPVTRSLTSRRLGAARAFVGGNWRAPLSGGNRHACSLSRGRGTKIRSVNGFARADEFRQRADFLSDQARRRSHRAPIETRKARRGGAAFQPHTAGTDRSA